MEPLDTDFEYTTAEPRKASAASRFSMMLIFPILGLLLVLVFILAAIFQLDLSGLVDGLVGVLILLFALFIVMIFWAMAPRAREM
ncbi:MAG TPA: hypothetical protein VFA41_03210 [Ktedonobacteraceae bacterium]|jgi:membrane-bound ClpP family serine protease|nr:hypothetical protein [Ktedonobacteraceae bacterium]